MPEHTARVTFLIAGTQKGGTAALAQFLAQHPQIFISRQKELHFFDTDTYFRGATPDYAWYHQHFEGSEGYRAVGEATPIYMSWPAAAPRIKAYNPAMKLIMILRNPAERANAVCIIMEHRCGYGHLPFRWAARCGRVCNVLLRFAWRRLYRCNTKRGFSSHQTNGVLEYFLRERISFLKTDQRLQDIVAHKYAALEQLLSWDCSAWCCPPLLAA